MQVSGPGRAGAPDGGGRMLRGEIGHQELGDRQLHGPQLLGGEVLQRLPRGAKQAGEYVSQPSIAGEPPHLQRQRGQEAVVEGDARGADV